MIKLNQNNKINATDIYQFVAVKTEYYHWLKRCIENADLKEGSDFTSFLTESTGGRPKREYEFTIDAAKEICIVSATSKAKELRRWLIDISNQRENLELITVKEAAFAVKVINCLKYVENQKEAYNLHQTKFINANIDISNPKYIYSEFAKYRANIVGWNKQQIDEAISKYLIEHTGYNKAKIEKLNTQSKLSIMDIGEAIRVACLDILYSKETNEYLANRFSMLCKNLANEMQVKPEKTNENNLFREKENIKSITDLRIE